MFETHDSGRLLLLCGPGEYLWGYVGIYFIIPWFHVTCWVVDEAGDVFTKTVMMSEVSQLIEMSQRENVKIKFVDLVSPGFLNGSDRWKMEPLRKIMHSDNEENPGLSGYIFVLENGKEYSYGSITRRCHQYQSDNLSNMIRR